MLQQAAARGQCLRMWFMPSGPPPQSSHVSSSVKWPLSLNIGKQLVAPHEPAKRLNPLGPWPRPDSFPMGVIVGPALRLPCFISRAYSEHAMRCQVPCVDVGFVRPVRGRGGFNLVDAGGIITKRLVEVGALYRPRGKVL